MKKKTIYEVVKASEELPEKQGFYFMLWDNDFMKGTTFWREQQKAFFQSQSLGEREHIKIDTWLKQSEKYVFDEDQFIDVVRALDLAQMELRAMYKKTGVKGSNVLDIIDSVYDELFKDSVYDELSKGIPETNQSK